MSLTIMKTIFLIVVFLFTSGKASSQHYSWTVTFLNGAKLIDVHPDSIQTNVLAVSSESGHVYWSPMDSIRSVAYMYNPTIVLLTMAGGIIGGTAGGKATATCTGATSIVR